MDYSIERIEGGAALVLAGDLTYREAEGFSNALGRLEHLSGERIEVRVSGVKAMDASGLAFILRMYDQSRRRGGHIVVRGVRGGVKSALERVRMHELVDIG